MQGRSQGRARPRPPRDSASGDGADRRRRVDELIRPVKLTSVSYSTSPRRITRTRLQRPFAPPQRAMPSCAHRARPSATTSRHRQWPRRETNRPIRLVPGVDVSRRFSSFGRGAGSNAHGREAVLVIRLIVGQRVTGRSCFGPTLEAVLPEWPCRDVPGSAPRAGRRSRSPRRAASHARSRVNSRTGPARWGRAGGDSRGRSATASRRASRAGVTAA